MDNRAVACIHDSALLDDVLRLAAAAGCDLDRAPDLVAARSEGQSAPLVVIDRDVAAAWRGAGLPRHPGLVIVCHDHHNPTMWEDALAIGATRVIKLPAAEDWLVSAFADAAEGPSGADGPVLAVVGGRGGSGASVFSCALGLGLLRRGRSGFLLDCDPHGGGLDLVVGAESLAGLRWSDLRVQSGRVSASALRTALPSRRRGDAELGVLACHRSGDEPVADAVAAVVDAGRRGGDTVICDLPRGLGNIGAVVLERATLVIVVMPAEVRAVASATGLARSLLARGATARLVVRGPSPGGLEAAEIAGAVGLPLLASMRPQPGLGPALERGEFTLPPRSPLAQAADTVLDELDTTATDRAAA